MQHARSTGQLEGTAKMTALVDGRWQKRVQAARFSLWEGEGVRPDAILLNDPRHDAALVLADFGQPV
jgi:hypothetical protein